MGWFRKLFGEKELPQLCEIVLSKRLLGYDEETVMDVLPEKGLIKTTGGFDRWVPVNEYVRTGRIDTNRYKYTAVITIALMRELKALVEVIGDESKTVEALKLMREKITSDKKQTDSKETNGQP